MVAAADDGRVVAVDPAGETRWTFTAGKDVRAPLALGPDDTIYAAALDGMLYALRPDGALRWSFTAGGPIASAPVIDAAGRV
ncbi:MAG: PQQ-binding-like beta-propeller repeat protein, partial [Myxococcales bacterium]|nr:PQQ-binding-like beta-propeller repeat protein [Myxococcales bacterium]